uniref:Uncharacterized protein n=1 Tax=Aegilops tauschii subsp. strangulata TaxID=200361 RepID=A0A453DNI7_AEGTS
MSRYIHFSDKYFRTEGVPSIRWSLVDYYSLLVCRRLLRRNSSHCRCPSWFNCSKPNLEGFWQIKGPLL